MLLELPSLMPHLTHLISVGGVSRCLRREAMEGKRRRHSAQVHAEQRGVNESQRKSTKVNDALRT